MTEQPRFDVPVRPAATVMLVRDGVDGLEVFMLQRTRDAAFGGGMFVFPGGGVDRGDASPSVEALCDGLTDASASSQLGLPSGGLAYWVAAIRECFEEAGVLLARPATGGACRFGDGVVAGRFATARRSVHEGALGLGELCRDEGLRLMTDAIHYVAHWITPRGETRRFDTRFFLARAPHDQQPLHDERETIASLWVRPSEALARREAGELEMMAPTLASLEFLAGCGSADEAIAAAAAIGVPPTVEPRMRFREGKPVGAVMPWEPGYDELS